MFSTKLHLRTKKTDPLRGLWLLLVPLLGIEPADYLAACFSGSKYKSRHRCDKNGSEEMAVNNGGAHLFRATAICSGVPLSCFSIAHKVISVKVFRKARDHVRAAPRSEKWTSHVECPWYFILLSYLWLKDNIPVLYAHCKHRAIFREWLRFLPDRSGVPALGKC